MGVVTWFVELSAEAWSALANLAVAVLTAILVGVGLYQVRQIREENKKSRTLAVCERYDTDPIIDAALRNLRKAWRTRDIHYNPRLYRIDLATLLNFLESICSGVEADIYEGEIVKRYFHDTFRFHIEEYVMSDLVHKMEIDRSSYMRMIDCLSLWDCDGEKDAGTKVVSHFTHTRFTFRLGGLWFFLRQR